MIGKLQPDLSYIDWQETALEDTRCTILKGTWFCDSSLSCGCKIEGKISLSKRSAQKFYWEKFNLRKVNELKVDKKVSDWDQNRFLTLEN